MLLLKKLNHFLLLQGFRNQVKYGPAPPPPPTVIGKDVIVAVIPVGFAKGEVCAV